MAFKKRPAAAKRQRSRKSTVSVKRSVGGGGEGIGDRIRREELKRSARERANVLIRQQLQGERGDPPTVKKRRAPRKQRQTVPARRSAIHRTKQRRRAASKKSGRIGQRTRKDSNTDSTTEVDSDTAETDDEMATQKSKTATWRKGIKASPLRAASTKRATRAAARRSSTRSSKPRRRAASKKSGRSRRRTRKDSDTASTIDIDSQIAAEAVQDHEATTKLSKTATSRKGIKAPPTTKTAGRRSSMSKPRRRASSKKSGRNRQRTSKDSDTASTTDINSETAETDEMATKTSKTAKAPSVRAASTRMTQQSFTAASKERVEKGRRVSVAMHRSSKSVSRKSSSKNEQHVSKAKTATSTRSAVKLSSASAAAKRPNFRKKTRTAEAHK